MNNYVIIFRLKNVKILVKLLRLKNVKIQQEFATCIRQTLLSVYLKMEIYGQIIVLHIWTNESTIISLTE